MQEDEIALPFAHLHRDAGKAGELGGERHEFVIMGGEQAAALYIVVDGFKHGPGDGEAVVGGGAAADFIEDDKAAVGGTGEDRRGFDHFDHKGGAAFRQIIGGANPAVEPIDHANMRRGSGDVAAGLGKDGDEGVLAQEGGFAGHVGAGDEPDPPVGRQIAIIGGETGAGFAHGEFDHGVAAGFDMEGGAGVYRGAAPVFRGRQFGQRGGDVEARKRGGGGGDAGGVGQRRFAQFFQMRGFGGERVIGGLGDFRAEFAQFRRGEADGAGHGLAVDEAAVDAQQRIGALGGDFDVIAEHIVVADLQRRDAGFGLEAGFECDHGGAAILGGVAQGIKRRVEAGADGAGQFDGRLIHQRAGELFDEGAEAGTDLAERFGEQFGWSSAGGQRVAQGQRAGKAGGELAEITRAPAADGEAGQRAGDIGQAGERVAGARTGERISDEPADQIEPGHDACRIGERGGDILAQLAGAGGGDGAIDGGFEAVARSAALQFKAGAGGSINGHAAAGQFLARRQDQWCS